MSAGLWLQQWTFAELAPTLPTSSLLPPVFLSSSLSFGITGPPHFVFLLISCHTSGVSLSFLTFLCLISSKNAGFIPPGLAPSGCCHFVCSGPGLSATQDSTGLQTLERGCELHSRVYLCNLVLVQTVGLHNNS